MYTKNKGLKKKVIFPNDSIILISSLDVIGWCDHTFSFYSW